MGQGAPGSMRLELTRVSSHPSLWIGQKEGKAHCLFILCVCVCIKFYLIF